MTPFWCTSSHLFLQQRGYLKHRRRILTKKQSDSELGERRKSYLSAVGQSRLHFVLECWGMIALDSKWRGIDVIWDFSTIRNNDLFSEATNCQVITCLGGENGQSFGTGRAGVLSIVREEVSLEMLAPPPTKTRFSLLPQAPWPPWTNNSLILCTTADLIVSLWRESPELHSVKWQMVHQQWAGRTSPAPAQAHRWAPTPLPVPWDRTQGKHGRKRETRIFTLLHLSANASLILSPSLAPSINWNSCC